MVTNPQRILGIVLWDLMRDNYNLNYLDVPVISRGDTTSFDSQVAELVDDIKSTVR